jgi:hypothetical protein
MDKDAIIKEIKETLVETGLKVTDIFGDADIKSTDIFKKEIDNAHEHAKRIEKKLGEERERIITITNELNDKENKIKKLNEVVSNTTVKSIFDQAKTERKLDDKETAFVEKKLGGFKSEKEGDELKADFQKFLDSQLDDYMETAKLLGVDVKKDKDDKKLDTGDGKSDGVDLTDPANNEFIPK